MAKMSGAGRKRHASARRMHKAINRGKR
jgi:hypothetical protein